eukprot:1148151-Pelagomonas_calceolata.AAC.1
MISAFLKVVPVTEANSFSLDLLQSFSRGLLLESTKGAPGPMHNVLKYFAYKIARAPGANKSKHDICCGACEATPSYVPLTGPAHESLKPCYCGVGAYDGRGMCIPSLLIYRCMFKANLLNIFLPLPAGNGASFGWVIASWKDG